MAISPPMASGGGPVHARIPIHAHSLISPKQSQLHNKLPTYMINLIIIYVVVNSFSMKNHKSLTKLRVGVNRYTGVNWSTTTTTNSHPQIALFFFFTKMYYLFLPFLIQISCPNFDLQIKYC